MAKKENKFDKASGVIFVGCMFIGMGVGFLLNHLVVGLFVGMGVGFLGMGIVYLVSKK